MWTKWTLFFGKKKQVVRQYLRPPIPRIIFTFRHIWRSRAKTLERRIQILVLFGFACLSELKLIPLSACKYLFPFFSYKVSEQLRFERVKNLPKSLSRPFVIKWLHDHTGTSTAFYFFFSLLFRDKSSGCSCTYGFLPVWVDIDFADMCYPMEPLNWYYKLLRKLRVFRRMK